MRSLIITGILMMILGVISLSYDQITFKTKEKVAKLGPIEATQEKTEKVEIPPIAGALVLAGGVALLVMGTRRGAGRVI